MQTHTPLKSSNLDKMPSSSPVREYLASDEGHVGRLAATNLTGNDKTTAAELDKFMQRVTDKNIVDDARDFIKGGNLNSHQGKE